MRYLEDGATYKVKIIGNDKFYNVVNEEFKKILGRGINMTLHLTPFDTFEAYISEQFSLDDVEKLVAANWLDKDILTKWTEKTNPFDLKFKNKDSMPEDLFTLILDKIYGEGTCITGTHRPDAYNSYILFIP